VGLPYKVASPPEVPPSTRSNGTFWGTLLRCLKPKPGTLGTRPFGNPTSLLIRNLKIRCFNRFSPSEVLCQSRTQSPQG